MRQIRLILQGVTAVGMMVTGFLTAQTPPQATPAITSAAPLQAAAEAVAGGRLHGMVKSGNIPLPGVSVTAQNTLTGKRYATTTDITGAWSMQIPQNGRYVVRTELAAFAQASQEAVLNATSHDHMLDFQLILASRAAQQEQQQARQTAPQNGARKSSEQDIQQLAGANPENLGLVSTMGSDTEAASGAANQQGAELPTVATNADFSSESVAVTGQAGQVSAMAGVDMDRLRDALETYRAQNGDQAPGSGGLFAGGGGGFGGGMGFGGPGGFGGGGGGRGNFRNFNPAQPHGSVFWDGSNSALNAEPFALQGQTQVQPA